MKIIGTYSFISTGRIPQRPCNLYQASRVHLDRGGQWEVSRPILACHDTGIAKLGTEKAQKLTPDASNPVHPTHFKTHSLKFQPTRVTAIEKTKYLGKC